MLGVGLGLGGIVATAAPAAAHASLQGTTPQQGEQVATAPTSVTLTFSEPVSVNARSVQVLDPGGHRVDRGTPRHPAGTGSQVVVDLQPGLPRASYAVVWHAVSADSHRVSGRSRSGSVCRPAQPPSRPRRAR